MDVSESKSNEYLEAFLQEGSGSCKSNTVVPSARCTRQLTPGESWAEMQPCFSCQALALASIWVEEEKPCPPQNAIICLLNHVPRGPRMPEVAS